MKSNISLFVIIIISTLFLSACTAKDKKNDKPTLKDKLNNTFIELAKGKYDSVQYNDGTKILISLEDMEKVYKLDISEFKTKDLGCDLKMSYVKIEVENNKKTYTSNLNCSGLAE